METDFTVNKMNIFGVTVCFSNQQRGFLYQGLQGSNPMVAMGKAGLLSHGLGGYGLPPGTAGTSAEHLWCGEFRKWVLVFEAFFFL